MSIRTPNELDGFDVGKLTNMYQSSSKSFSNNEIQQLMDRCYVTDGNYQLSATDIAELRKRHMAPLTMNWCEKLKRSLIGIFESNPIDPVAIPQNQASENGADIATKLVRYLLNKSNMSTTRLDMASDFVVEGVAVGILEIETITNRRTNVTNYLPCVKRVSPYDFFYDPSSRAKDFSDATFMGIRKWISENQLENMYPERFKELGSPINDNTFAGTFDYQDSTAIELVDRKNKKVALIELYDLNNGKWNRTVFAANGVYAYDEEQFTDTYGNSFCPITAVSNIVDIKHNYRIGSIRRVRNSQDVVNQLLIKTAASINSRQVIQTEQAITSNPAEVRREASRPDGIVPFGYSFTDNSANIQGNMQMLENQVNFILDSIPNASVQQTIQSNNASGRAKLVDQELGLIEYSDMLKTFSFLEETVYKKVWYAATEYCTEAQVINVSGDPKAPDYININHVTGFENVPVIDPQTGQIMLDQNGMPMLNRQPIIENSLMEIDVDITFRQVPSTGTLRSEVFDSFVQLIQSGVQINSPEFSVLLDLSPLEDKQEIRDEIAKWMGPNLPFNPEAQAQQQAQQAQLQNLQLQAQIKEGELRLTKMEADINLVRSNVLKNLASVHETEQDMQIEAQSEAVQINHDIAESNLKVAKANAINEDLEQSQQEHGLNLAMHGKALAGLSSLLNN